MSSQSFLIESYNNFASIANQFNTTGYSPITMILTFFITLMIAKYGIDSMPLVKDNKKIGTVMGLIFAIYTSQFSPALRIIENIFPSIGVLIIGFTAFSFATYAIFPQKASNYLLRNVIKWIVFGTLFLIFWEGLFGTGPTIFESGSSFLRTTEAGLLIGGFILITVYDIALIILGILLIAGGAYALGYEYNSGDDGFQKKLINNLFFKGE